MKIKRIDATISTTKLRESRDFYIEHFGFELVYESDWYIELLSPTLAAGVSFTLPQHEIGEYFNGQGLILSFGVDDVDNEYQRLKREGLPILQELQDKPWGERSFVVNDPSGVHIYVYSLIPAEPEYQVIYDKYKK